MKNALNGANSKRKEKGPLTSQSWAIFLLMVIGCAPAPQKKRSKGRGALGKGGAAPAAIWSLTLLWSREGVCGQVDAAVFSSSWWSYLHHPLPLLL